MRKRLLFFYTVLTIISVTSCDFLNSNDAESDQIGSLVGEEITENLKVEENTNSNIFSDFIYDVGPRFNAIKKSELKNVKAFSDLIEEEHANRITYYKKVSVMVLNGDEQTDIKETGKDGVFTSAQIELLQSSDYATNLKIWADYQEVDFYTGELVFSTWTPHLTVVPEKQASFAEGNDALKKYLKEETEEVRTHVDPDKLQPAKLYFTVTKNGTIENVYLDRPSGYPLVDKKMIELITTTVGAWKPAENNNGEKVDQELVVSFGLKGC
jgi:hypothetical protein